MKSCHICKNYIYYTQFHAECSIKKNLPRDLAYAETCEDFVENIVVSTLEDMR